MALARAARQGLQVNGGRRWASSEEDFEQQRANEQDATVYTVAGFSGLRQGELRALRSARLTSAVQRAAITAADRRRVLGPASSRIVPSLQRPAFGVGAHSSLVL